jgi:hypothetical protein
MKTHVLRGSKQEIVDGIARLDGEIREAIVYVEEPADATAVPTPPPAGKVDETVEDMFAEMEPYMVKSDGEVDYSREAIYTRMEGE